MSKTHFRIFLKYSKKRFKSETIKIRKKYPLTMNGRSSNSLNSTAISLYKDCGLLQVITVYNHFLILSFFASNIENIELLALLIVTLNFFTVKMIITTTIIIKKFNDSYNNNNSNNNT